MEWPTSALYFAETARMFLKILCHLGAIINSETEVKKKLVVLFVKKSIIVKDNR